MAEVQSLDKPEWIRNCAQLAEHFSNRVIQTHTGSNEVRLIFDRYDLPFSLKAATRVRRQGSQAPVHYHITDTTHIAKVPKRQLLSHTKTKMELTISLGQKIKEYADRSGRQLVVAWGSVCKATHKDVAHLQSNQEEADTPLMLPLMVQLNYRFTLRTHMSSSLLLDVIQNCVRTRCLSREEGNTIALLS